MKKLILNLMVLLTGYAGFSQDLHFSQFSETPLLRNPALAGIFLGDIRIQGVNRSQWGSVTTPFQTTSLGIEYKRGIGKSEDFISFGGEILHDKAGTISYTTTSVMPVFNYHKSLSEEQNSYLSAGFMAGIVQKRFDRSKVTTDAQFNGNTFDASSSDGEKLLNNNFYYLDGSAGISYNRQIGEYRENNFYIAAAYHHFNQSARQSFYGTDKTSLAPKLVFSGAIKMAVAEGAAASFYADYTSQGKSREIMTGLLYSYILDDVDNPTYLIEGGLYYRWKDALIPVLKLDYKPFIISVSYDVNISSLKTASNYRGGFELSITYQSFFATDYSTRYATHCPKM
jgi:type IX secretion system PorP/SprF family membrane protein